MANGRGERQFALKIQLAKGGSDDVGLEAKRWVEKEFTWSKGYFLSRGSLGNVDEYSCRSTK
jgi:hypothetical protein